MRPDATTSLFERLMGIVRSRPVLASFMAQIDVVDCPRPGAIMTASQGAMAKAA